MNANDNGGPAFPCMPPQDTGAGSAAGYPYPHGGMTLRDYFAAQSISAVLAPNPVTGRFAQLGDFEACAGIAYAMADAMLKAREA